MITLLLVLNLTILFTYSLKLISNGLYYGYFIAILSCMAIITVIFPEIAAIMAQILGVGRGTDLLLYFSFMIGLILVLAIHVKITNLNRKITQLSRYIALNKNED